MNISVEITDYLPCSDSLAIGNIIFNDYDSLALEGIHLGIKLEKNYGTYYLACSNADQYNIISRLEQEIKDGIIHEFVTKHIKFMKRYINTMEEDDPGRKILNEII